LDSISENQKEVMKIDSFIKLRGMKSLAIIGMMFCSVGLFAQQQGNDAPKKVRAYTIERPVSNKRAQMATAPIRHVDVRKTTMKKKRYVVAKKAHVRDERMIRPLKRKSSNVKATR